MNLSLLSRWHSLKHLVKLATLCLLLVGGSYLTLLWLDLPPRKAHLELAMGDHNSLADSQNSSPEDNTTSHQLSEKQARHLFRKAKESYFAGSYLEAYGYLKGHSQAFFHLPDGCNLMLSVFAETKKLSLLENTARSCLAMNKSVPIAADAIAMSLSRVGQSEQALEIILNIPNYQLHSRILVAISQLFLYLDQPDKARKHLLQAIEVGSPWSPWLERIFQYQAFQEHEFLTAVTLAIIKKEHVVHDKEQKLLDLLKMKNMTQEVELMTERHSKNI
ncbi:MAG: hypothetical protein OXC40_00720 [Proteobacteria bacterium]|nr:hypothetical protein [Pseudomonadota bacterium]